MDIVWQVDDGFVGNGTHSIEIEEEFFEDYDTVEEMIDAAGEVVNDEFVNNITWTFTDLCSLEYKFQKILDKRNKEKDNAS